MSTESFRSALVANLLQWRDANFASLPLLTENGPVPDEASLGPVWLDLELRWYGASLVSIESRPVGRHKGAISLCVYYRLGEGTRLSDQIMDSLNERLRHQRLGGAVLLFGQRSVPTEYKGWYKTALFFPFQLDEY